MRIALLTFSILVLSVQGSLAHAQRFSGSVRGGSRSAPTASAHWTLADFLAQKNRIRLMDYWLAVHTSEKWLETTLGGGALHYDVHTSSGGATATTSQNAQIYRGSVYVSIFGLEGEYEKTNNDLEAYGGAIGLRLLGASQQGTHLTAKYGLHRLLNHATTPPTQWDNQFAEGELVMHLFDFLGIQGNYRYYVPARSSTGIQLKGTKAQAGAFIEFSVFHIFATYFLEKMEQDNAGAVSNIDRQGFEYGAQMYF